MWRVRLVPESSHQRLIKWLITMMSLLLFSFAVAITVLASHDWCTDLHDGASCAGAMGEAFLMFPPAFVLLAI